MTDRSTQIAVYLDGSLDPAAMPEFRAWLNADDAHAAALVEQMILESHLRESLLAHPAERPASAGRPIDAASPPHRSAIRVPRFAFSLAAALLLAAAAVAVYFAALTPDPRPLPPDSAPIATVLDTTPGSTLLVDDTIVNSGDDIRSGTLSLDAGSANFRLGNGVAVTLRGNTQLTVHSPMSATFTRGSASFDCPPAAKGYTVHLPGGAKVVDLGTRFSVSMRDDGPPRVRVIEGRVSIHRSAAETVEMAAGYEATIDAAGGPIAVRPMPTHTAYIVPAGTVGNQPFTGAMGMDFVVDMPITVTHLGAFDSGSDGLKGPITVTLYRRDDHGTPDLTADDTGEPVASVVVAGREGELIGGTRFVELDKPITMPAGEAYSIIAAGYGPDEPDGNQSRDVRTWSTDDGDGALRFVGSGRHGPAQQFPPNVGKHNDPTRYAAGSFRYLTARIETPQDLQPELIPSHPGTETPE